MVVIVHFMSLLLMVTKQSIWHNLVVLDGGTNKTNTEAECGSLFAIDSNSMHGTPLDYFQER